MDYMREALRLARRGMGQTSPNPMVGAVLVKDHKVVGKGYHKIPGEPHAEIIAIKEAGDKARSATLYVNLEPCCHWGRTPPCTKAIISAGIKEVHIAVQDPSPWVNGNGIKELEAAGIKVILGECESQALELNRAYFKWVKTGMPFVSLKAAITLDGKIADLRGGSKWITNELSRKFVHRLRAQVDAVMVGVGTVITDDPELTVRWVKGKDPKRIILDAHLRIPRDAKVLGNGCIIASCIDTVNALQNIQNATIWQVKANANGKVDILEVLKRAGKESIQSILVEGGKEVFTECLKFGIVDSVYFFIAPKLIGDGLPVIGDLGINHVASAIALNSVRIKKIGDDILVVGSISNRCVR